MSVLAGFLNGYADGRSIKLDEEARKRLAAQRDAAPQGGYGAQNHMPAHNGATGHYDQNGPPPNGSAPQALDATGAGPQLKVADPVADDLPPHARAFLNAIAAPESAGAYNVRYTPQGAATFDEASATHPRIYERTHDGKKSSAAGRYQFTYQTWDDTGGGAFTRAAQDRRAWQLAQDRYRASTGGNLDSALRSDGVTSSILTALAPTWAGFGSQKGRNKAARAYRDSYSRYSAAPASQPASTTASKPASQKAAKLTITPQAAGLDWAWMRQKQKGTI